MRQPTTIEIARNRARLSVLHTSRWIVDVVTAYIMDSGHGGAGLSEDVARVKAGRILGVLGLDPLANTNRDWTEKGAAVAALARGVLREPLGEVAEPPNEAFNQVEKAHP